MTTGTADSGVAAGPVPVDAAGVIVADVPCVRCGYNLRGLTPGRFCPECGTPAGASTSGPMLRFADAGWVRRVWTGLKLLIIAYIVSLVVYFLAPLEWSLHGTFICAEGLYLLAVVLNTIGILKAAAPEPAPASENDPGARRVAHALALPLCLITALREIFYWGRWYGLPFESTEPGLTTLVAVVGGVLAIAFMMYLVHVLRRTRRPGLRLVAWAAVGLLALAMTLRSLAPLSPQAYGASWYGATRFWHDLLAAASRGGQLAALLSTATMLVLVILTRRAIRAEQRIAAAWAAAQGAGGLAPSSDRVTGP